MAQSTVALVKELGGIQEASDYNLWRFSAPDELDAAIVRAQAVAAAWIRRREPNLYTSTDPDTLTLLAVGESWLALHILTEPLKSRRVFGTHYPLDQEGSDRFEQLIDVEYLQQAQFALGLDLTVVNEPAAFARPTLQVGPVMNRATEPLLESPVTQILDLADEARGPVEGAVVIANA